MLPAMRPATGWLLLPVSEGDPSLYETAIDVADEAWLLLHQVSEVSDRGRAFVAALQPALNANDVERVWREFRSFVRQAEAFYHAATPLPWKSAPLNYYYSFLNLAKAVLVVRGLLPTGKIRHGLSSIAPLPNSGISDWKVEVRDGVFPRLFQHLLKNALPMNSGLDIDQLLAYSWPVSVQYVESGLGSPRLSPGRCVYRQDGTHSWALIAVPKTANIAAHPLLGPLLAASFKEVEPNKDFALRVLAFHGVATAQYQFWESLNAVPLSPDGSALTSELLAPLDKALPGAVNPPVLNTEIEFILSLPYDTGSGFVPMSELVATYAVIFFLSELVRYYPERLDYIAETRDGWLVESFVRSFPTQMLRLMLSATLGRTIILKRQ
jgi:YaaC-like Protein